MIGSRRCPACDRARARACVCARACARARARACACVCARACARARACALALALAFAFSPACGQVHLQSSRPHLSVDPAALPFGRSPLHVALGRTLRLSNLGSAALTLSTSTLSGPQAAQFAAGPLPAALAPGESANLQLSFTAAAAGTSTALLHLLSSDPDQPDLSVPLSGVGWVSGAIWVAPSALDLGRVGEGQSAIARVTYASVGAEELTVASIALSATGSPAYGLVGSVPTPAVLAPGTARELAVRFAPLPGQQPGAADGANDSGVPPGAWTGALDFLSSDPDRPRLSLPLSATVNRAPLPALAAQALGVPRTTSTLTTGAGATVLLDGVGSTDPDGDLPLALEFRLVLKPAGSQARLATGASATSGVPGAASGPASGPASATGTAALLLDLPGLYSVELRALDATGLASLAPARLDLRALPTEALLLQLLWDRAAPNLDLHLLQAGAALGGTGDCGAPDPDPDWFGQGPDGNPHLASDQLVGYGPEVIRWTRPAEGAYDLAVVYRAAHGMSPAATTATLRVFSFGVLAADLTHAFGAEGEVWRAGQLLWPSGRVVAAAGGGP